MAAPAEEKFTTERIIAWHRWHDKLLSFRLTRPEGYRFTPGQFARLGLPLDNGGFVWRAYSMVSANWDEHLEFYSIVVPDGLFTSRLALLGVKVNHEANLKARFGASGIISEPGSTVAMVIPTNEEWVIAHDALELVEA